MKDEDYKKILDFFYEIGQLKKIPRAGWVQLGINNPESVADHATRSVFISFILAKLEGADPYKAGMMSAFHESPECRIQDLHKTAQRYLNKDEAEEKAITEQYDSLPEDIGKEMKELCLAFEIEGSKEQMVAKDADYIECAIQAKEYLEQGYSNAQNWIDNCHKCVRSESAKKFLKLLESTTSINWFKELKKIKR